MTSCETQKRYANLLLWIKTFDMISLMQKQKDFNMIIDYVI